MSASAAPLPRRSSLRNGEHGYGLVTKTLHWLTVLAVLTQFVLGYVMVHAEGLLGPGNATFDAIVPAHVVVGLIIIVVTAVRLTWRIRGGLPPWTERLSPTDRKAEAVVEKLLYTLLFLMPATGLGFLLLTGLTWPLGPVAWRAPLGIVDDGVLLVLHVATHIAFFAVLSVHLILVGKNRLVPRMTFGR